MSERASKSLSNLLEVNPQWAKLPLFDRKGWKTVRFGDVVRMQKEQVDPVADGIERYVAGEHMETENVHIRKWGNVGDGYLGPAFIRGFRKGQVLYGSRRTYLKKVAVAEWDGVTANTTFVLEAVDDKLLQALLPWIMLSERFTKHSISESKGSTNPYINFPDIAKFEFALPPLEQQRRIAEILWAIDEVSQRYLNTSEVLFETRSATIKNHLTEAQKFSGVKKLEELADIKYGITLGGYRAGLPVERPYLRVANVGREKIELAEIKTIKCTDDEAKKFALADGDILIVEGHASVDEIGRASIWRCERSEMLHQNHLIRARCSTLLLPEYLCIFVNSFYGKAYVRSRAKSSSGLNTINSTVVKEFPIPDTQIKKQAEFVWRIKEYDVATTVLAGGGANLNQMLTDFLNKAFS